jgi:hypothetical protein
VCDRGDRLAADAEVREHLPDPGEEALGGVGGGGRGLGGGELAGLLVERDDVGERAAGVDADADAAGHRRRPSPSPRPSPARRPSAKAAAVRGIAAVPPCCN